MKHLSYKDLYKRLRSRFGYLNWWPGETRDEIIIGAILTQQATWKNVEKAIANLKSEDAVDLKKIRKMDIRRLERLVRPSGFYRQKAARLKGIASYIFGNYGSLDQMFDKSTLALRKELLSLNGVGRETADSIILYVAGKPIFVIDAYTKRIMSRVYGIDEKIDYDELRSLLSDKIGEDLDTYKDFHAQFVELGKENCRPKPRCGSCPINEYCKYFMNSTGK